MDHYLPIQLRYIIGRSAIDIAQARLANLLKEVTSFYDRRGCKAPNDFAKEQQKLQYVSDWPKERCKLLIPLN
jgi:hypothetical protein